MKRFKKIVAGLISIAMLISVFAVSVTVEAADTGASSLVLIDEDFSNGANPSITAVWGGQTISYDGGYATINASGNPNNGYYYAFQVNGGTQIGHTYMFSFNVKASGQLQPYFAGAFTDYATVWMGNSGTWYSYSKTFEATNTSGIVIFGSVGNFQGTFSIDNLKLYDITNPQEIIEGENIRLTKSSYGTIDGKKKTNAGDTVCFKLANGSPKNYNVTVNGEIVTADGDGYYSFTMPNETASIVAELKSDAAVTSLVNLALNGDNESGIANNMDFPYASNAGVVGSLATEGNNHYIHIDATANTTTWATSLCQLIMPMSAGRKYLYSLDARKVSSSSGSLCVNNRPVSTSYTFFTISTAWKNVSEQFTAIRDSASLQFYMQGDSKAVYDLDNIEFYDVTNAYTITADEGVILDSDCCVDVNGTKLTNAGDKVKFTAAGNSDNYVVYINGVTAEAENGVYSFTMPAENVTITSVLDASKMHKLTLLQGLEITSAHKVIDGEIYVEEGVDIVLSAAEEIDSVIVDSDSVYYFVDGTATIPGGVYADAVVGIYSQSYKIKCIARDDFENGLNSNVFTDAYGADDALNTISVTADSHYIGNHCLKYNGTSNESWKQPYLQVNGDFKAGHTYVYTVDIKVDSDGASFWFTSSNNAWGFTGAFGQRGWKTVSKTFTPTADAACLWIFVGGQPNLVYYVDNIEIYDITYASKIDIDELYCAVEPIAADSKSAIVMADVLYAIPDTEVTFEVENLSSADSYIKLPDGVAADGTYTVGDSTTLSFKAVDSISYEISDGTVFAKLHNPGERVFVKGSYDGYGAFADAVFADGTTTTADEVIEIGDFAEGDKVFCWNSLSAIEPLSRLYTKKTDSVKVFLAGDSTTCPYDHNVTTMTGWGECFGKYLDENTELVNLAIGGFKVSDFVKSRLSVAQSQWSAGDYMIISYGINDLGETALSNGTTVAGYTALDYYKANLADLIQTAQADGINVIVCSEQDMRNNDYSVMQAAAGEVALEMGVTFIDLASLNLADNMYVRDNVHLVKSGAEFVAAGVADLIKGTSSDLRFYIK